VDQSGAAGPQVRHARTGGRQSTRSGWI